MSEEQSRDEMQVRAEAYVDEVVRTDAICLEPKHFAAFAQSELDRGVNKKLEDYEECLHDIIRGLPFPGTAATEVLERYEGKAEDHIGGCDGIPDDGLVCKLTDRQIPIRGRGAAWT